MLRSWIVIAAAAAMLGGGAAAAEFAKGPPELLLPGADHFRIKGLVRAAERGDPRAQTRLGFMHETGQGAPQDYLVAAMWYRQAAEQGEPTAQHLLGLMYDKGFGVPRDLVEAHKWLNLAAGRAPSHSRDYFARMRNAIASKMSNKEIAEAQWLARQWAPVKRGR